MPAGIAKNLGNLGTLFLDRRQFYISPQTFKQLWPSVTPFLSIVSNRSMRTDLMDPIFKLFEHRDPWIQQTLTVDTITTVVVPTTDTASGAIDIASTEGLPVNIDASFRGLELEVRAAAGTKKGVAVIHTTPSDSTITVKSLSPGALSIVTGDILHVIGNARGEGQFSPEAWSDELRTIWGSTQIMRTPVHVTGTLFAASLRGANSELARLRVQKSKEHNIQKERTFLFGNSLLGGNLDPSTPLGSESGDRDTWGQFDDRGRTDSDGKKIRSTLGLVSAIERYGEDTATADNQNIFEIDAATYDYSSFVDDMEKVFQYVPESGFKLAIAGAGALGYWSKLDADTKFAGSSGWNIQIQGTQRTRLGFNIRMLETPHGVLGLVWAPVLRGAYRNTMLVINDENMEYMQYRPHVFRTNILTDNAYDGVKDEYFSDEGMGFALIESHKMFNIINN